MGEGNVVGATAGALLEVNGEGNIYIYAGKERKPGRTPRKAKETRKDTTEVVAPSYRSLLALFEVSLPDAANDAIACVTRVFGNSAVASYQALTNAAAMSGSRNASSAKPIRLAEKAVWGKPPE
jgi:hypothetical protein